MASNDRAPAYSARPTALLLQTDGFESFTYVQIDTHSRDAAVGPERCDRRSRELDDDTAGTPAPVDATDGNHSVADLTHVLQLQTPLGKLFVDVERPLLDPRMTPIGHSRDGGERRLQLDVGIEVLPHDTETA